MVLIKKQDGSQEEFREDKLLQSLQRSGASSDIASNILGVVRNKLYDGIPTYEIFKMAFGELRKVHPSRAEVYDLKNSLLRLGVEGFSFETLVREVFEAEGYACEQDKIVQGTLITHEIDVIARKDDEVFMIECKHHDTPWKADHIHTALYVYARFLEVKRQFTRPMLVTNTKFSPQVITYARGVGLELLGWSYPREGNLQDLIEKHKLYPITMLKSLPQKSVRLALAEKIVTIPSLRKRSVEELANVLKLPKTKVSSILKEAEMHS